MSLVFISELADIPENTELSIFGAGELGSYLAELLIDNRPDVTIRTFIDTNKMGSVKGVPIINPVVFLKRTEKDHLVVVATHFWLREVLYLLKGEGFRNLAVSACVKQPETDYSQALIRYEEHVSIIENMMDNPRSLQVWKAVVSGMKGDLSGMLQCFVEKQGLQYLDYVDIKKGDTVVEGGVFDGSNTLQFARLVGGEGNVFAFDPFLDTIRDFPLQVHIEQQALWSEKATVYLSKKGAGSFVSPDQRAGSLPVMATDIDSYLNGRPVEYIKLDVEGAEPEVIQGAKQTIRMFRPSLAVCIYHSPEHFFEIPLMLADLCRDYRFFLESYSPSMGDTVLIAIPQEKAGLNGEKND